MQITERVILTAADDRLDRQTFIQKLSQALVMPDGTRATGVVLGISGEWGSGKSSVLAFLADHLKKQSTAIVLKFDPWLISGRDDLIAIFFAELGAAIRGSTTEKDERVKTVIKSICAYIGALSPLADVASIAIFGLKIPVISKLVGLFTSRLHKKLTDEPPLDKRKKNLETALKALGIPIVVLIDEVDRLEDREVRAIAQLVRSVADLPQISYVLAYDQLRVMEALGSDAGNDRDERIARGRSYLEKIVQYHVPLPTAFTVELVAFANSLLGDIASQIGTPANWASNERYQQLIKVLIPGAIRTPRDVKRWIGLTQVFSAMFRNEVDWVDLLAWAALLTKAPQTGEYIRSNPGKVCSEIVSPTYEADWMYYATMEKDHEKRIAAVMYPGEKTQPIEELLKFMFPVLRSENQREESSPDCIRHKRPLLTVIRNGQPPGFYSRNDIVSALKGNGRGVVELLERGIVDKEQKAALLARLYEIYPYVSDIDHDDIWLMLSDHLKRQVSGWAERMFVWMNLGHELSELFDARLKVEKSFIEVAKRVSQRLCERDDWEIYPTLLWDHMWGYGLFEARARHEQPMFWSSGESEKRLIQLSNVFVERIFEHESFLETLNNCYPIYIAMRTGIWDESVRARFAQLARTNRILDSFVALIFKPGYSVEISTIEQLVGNALFSELISRRLSDESLDPALRTAYQNAAERGRG